MFQNPTCKYRLAFTLAEVLIALAIIGIVAAMTIPSLVQKFEEKARITALKKFYATITQAVQMAVIEHGTPDMWGIGEEPSVMLTYIMPYMGHAKMCGGGGEKCHASDKLYWRNGTSIENYIFNGDNTRFGLQLSDGMILGVYSAPGSGQGVTSQEPSNCSISLGTGKANNICGEYMIDINGSASPNTYGKDVFIFNLIKDGTLNPVGTREYTTSQYTFDEGCLAENAQGWGCTGWVIENENMDYWHCDNLSWDGKRKCSK